MAESRSYQPPEKGRSGSSGNNPPTAPIRTGQLSLLQIMISLIYFAIVFWAIRQYMTTGKALFEVVVGILIGAGIGLVGLRLVWKVPRMAFLGWAFCIVGYLVASCSAISIRTSSLNPPDTWSSETLWAIVIKLIINLPALSILIAAIGYLNLRQSTNDQNALLGILALCAERSMPLSAGVQAFSSQVSGIFQIWAETLAELLRRGIPLSESLESLPGLASRPARLLIRIGDQSGRLGQGLIEAVASRTAQLSLVRQIGTQMAYLFWVGCSGMFISTFMMYFIMPKFEAIFKDFGIVLPDVTINMIKLSHFAIDYSWIPVLTGFAASIAFLTSYYTGGGMNIPLIDRLFARRHTILILRALRISIEAEQPILRTLEELAQSYPNHWVRHKLALAAADVRSGHDWILSMGSTGLLKPSDVGVLTSAQRVGNLVWAIRERVETGERRWNFRLQWVMQLIFIASMLIIGAIVFLLAVAYFAPLTTLIMRLT